MITTTLKGIYSHGKFELEKPVSFDETMEVVVIFLQPEKKKEDFNPQTFFGLWKDMSLDWDEETRNIRNEWERDI